MRSTIIILLLLSFMSCSNKDNKPIILTIDKNWSFKSTIDSIWQNAQVPGNIHTDLLYNNVIPHPFEKDNAKDLEWISETDWEYKTTFTVDKEILTKKHIDLEFQGLDTYALVYLNDSLIVNTNNAFKAFIVNIKPIIHPVNQLKIVFKNSSFVEEKAKSNISYNLPEGNRIFTRKAQFQYGWDWGPKLNTSGIWKPITLNAWDDYKIKTIEAKFHGVKNNKAELAIKLNSNNNTGKTLTYDLYVNDTKQTTLNQIPSSGPEILPLIIDKPQLWWPHNIGVPYIYDIKVVVKDGQTVLDSMQLKKGLRTIELVNEKDSIGESFYFKVNGVPVFAKGANYIPQNSFQNNVTKIDYETLLNDVVSANMNMLRVWGGGIYEDDIFYDLCDEKGVLVWQDFMFACAMYPGDKNFLENVKEEAEYNVIRLQNHASIALWCGNNENSEGWYRWGWQRNRNKEEKEEIWNNYLKIFDSILPNTVEKYSDVDYWETSPKYGRGNPKYKLEGDAHDWWIWHDEYPFEHLETNEPRFMSEFGFQSFPSFKTIHYINQNKSLNITSDAIKFHQKHKRGFEIIDNYMHRDFPVPKQPEDYIYMSQLLQAYGITKGIEAHRRAQPKTMGTLYWQLNDCWPAISWSSIDFFGHWKALHYKAKRSFENIKPSSILINDTIYTYLINDKRKAIRDTLHLKLITFKGDEIWSTKKVIDAKAHSSSFAYSLSAKNIDKTSTVLVTSFNGFQSKYFLEKPKNLNLESEKITCQIHKNKNGFIIELESKTLQKDVFLFTDKKGFFEDNFFDLLPNEIKHVEFKTTSSTFDVNNDLKIKTLNQFIN